MNTKLRLLFGWTLTLASASMTACGSGSGDKPLTELGYCQQRAVKECDAIGTACGVTANACQAARVSACNAEVAMLESPQRPFRPENVPACVNMAGDVYKKTPVTTTDRDALAIACNRVFSGKKKATDTCLASDYECDVNLICDTSRTTPTCATKTIVTGMFCGNPGEICPGPQYCTDGTAGARVCAPRKMLGDACSATAPCLDTFYCDATSTCVNKVTVAGKCTQNSDCASDVSYCDPYAGNTCDRGFEPTRFSPECGAFGSTVAGPGAGGSGGA